MQYLLNQDEYDEYLSLKERSEELKFASIDNLEEIKNLIRSAKSVDISRNPETMSDDIRIIFDVSHINPDVMMLLEYKMQRRL